MILTEAPVRRVVPTPPLPETEWFACIHVELIEEEEGDRRDGVVNYKTTPGSWWRCTQCGRLFVRSEQT